MRTVRGAALLLALAVLAALADLALAAVTRPEIPLPRFGVLLVGLVALYGRRGAVIPGAVLVASVSSPLTVTAPAAWVTLHVGLALAVYAARPALFGDHPVTRFLAVGTGTLAFRLGEVAGFGGPPAVVATVPTALGSAVATGLLATLAFSAFSRLPSVRRATRAAPARG